MKVLTVLLGTCLGVMATAATSALADEGRLFGAERYSTLPGSGGAELHSADLNNDNHQDLVVMENGAGGFSVHLGDGMGGFSLLGSHTLLEGSQALQLADIDGDDILDVVVRESFQQGSTLTVFLGTGGGDFGPGQNNSFGLTDVDEIKIDDLNDDGNPDLVAITFDNGAFTNELNVLMGLPPGSANFFGPPTTLSFPSFAEREVSILDVNADNALDIVITAGSTTNTHQVFLNDGSGAYAATAQGQLPSGGSLLSPVKGADANGDGNVDLIYGVSQFGSASQIGVLAGDGSGNFGAPVLTSFGLSGVLSVVVSDFNNDGNIDVAGPNFINDALVWLPGNGDLTFGAAVFGGSGGAPFDTLIIDADEDGIDDLVALNISSDDFSVHRGTGTDSFFETPRVNPIGAGASAVAIGDLTGNGIAEAVSANSTAGTITLLSGLQDGAYKTRVDVSDNLIDPIDVEIALLNDDSFNDVIVADRIQDAVLVFAGDGAGGLSAPTVLQACNAPTRLGVGDVSGDDNVDIVVACIGSNDIAVFLGDGVGNYGIASFFPAVNEPQQLVLADVDDDGNLDVVLADSTQGNSGVRILLGSGAGTFGPAILAASGSVVASVALGDINNDNALDIAFADLIAGVRVVAGLGNAAFGAPVTVPGATQAIDVGFLDTDNDGFDDVISVHNGGGPRSRGLSVARSLGDGSFEPDRVFAIATGVDAPFAESGIPRTLTIADLNNDQLQDVVVSVNAAEFDGGISIDLNRSGAANTTDSDGDGVADAVDNCALLANSDQRDTDGDGFGNRCDPDLNNDQIVNFVDLSTLSGLFLTEDADADLDGDGFVNFVDLGILRDFFLQPPGPGAIR